MTLLLSHSTALRRLRMMGRQDAPRDPCRMKRELTAKRYFLHVPFADDAALHDIDFPWAAEDMLDVLVPNGDARRRSRQLRCHVWGEEPPQGSFLLLGPHVLVSSPEFMLLQMAHELDVVQLVRLGCELCGTYTLDPSVESGISSRQPLSTPDDLIKFSSLAGSSPGRRKAEMALRHILANSASPRETDLAMLLCLPKRLGGYGLPHPEINPWIKTGGGTSGLRAADLFWRDALLDVEYDSTYFHAGDRQLARDSARRAELRESGIDVLTVTNAQIHDMRELDRVARLIRTALGLSDNEPIYDYASRKMSLRRELLGS